VFLTWNINAIRDDCISTAKHVRQSTTHDRSTAHEVTAGVGADDGNTQATRMTRLRGNQAGILARRGRTLPPRLRRLMLLGHLLVSVGALGLYLGLLTLSIVGLTTKDLDLLRAGVIGNVMAAPPDPGSVAVFLVTVLAIAVAIYVVNTGLAIYKPWGMIARRS